MMPSGNREAEQGLLGSLIHPQATWDLAHELASVAPPEHVTDPFLREVYLAALELYRDDGQPELLSLKDYLERRLQDPPNDLAVRLVEIQEAVPSPANARFYARRVADVHRVRRAWLVAHDLTQQLPQTLNGGTDEIERSWRELQRLATEGSSGLPLRPHRDLAPATPKRNELCMTLLRGTSHLLAAPAKQGKSTIAAAVAAAVATGYDPRRAAVNDHAESVLWLTAEEQPEQVAWRVGAILRAWEVGVTPAITYARVEDLGAKLGAVRATVARLKPALVVVDTLPSALAFRDENASAEWHARVPPLLDACDPAALLALHHAGKRLREKSSGQVVDTSEHQDYARGSSAAAGLFEAVLTLSGDLEDELILRRVAARWARKADLALHVRHLEDRDEIHVRLLEARLHATYEETLDRWLTLLEERIGVNNDELRQASGLRDGMRFRTYRDRAIAEGQIERRTRGMYARPGAPTASEIREDRCAEQILEALREQGPLRRRVIEGEVKQRRAIIGRQLKRLVEDGQVVFRPLGRSGLYDLPSADDEED